MQEILLCWRTYPETD